MKYYLIYQIRNKLNGMIYIGQHQTDNINDDYMGSGIRIQRAIEKYGVDNFEKTILFECSSEEEMNKKEAEIVNEDFIARDDVYNITLGGRGGWNHITFENRSIASKNGWINKSIEAREKYAERAKYIYLGKKRSIKSRMKTSESLHKLYSLDPTKNGMFGKHHSNETKKKMSEKHQGEKKFTIWNNVDL